MWAMLIPWTKSTTLRHVLRRFFCLDCHNKKSNCERYCSVDYILSNYPSIYVFQVNTWPHTLTTCNQKSILLSEYPKITSHSPSPFYAVANRNDILEITSSTDNDIKAITWYKDGIKITTNKNFSFIGKSKYYILERLVFLRISRFQNWMSHFLAIMNFNFELLDGCCQF